MFKEYKIKNLTNGVYVGDICYALTDDVYDNVWSKADYKDGLYSYQNKQFAVHSTAHGDGCYDGYSVDAGVIGIVDLRLAEKYPEETLNNLGSIHKDVDEAHMTVDENCNFTIKLFKDGKLMQSFDIITYDAEEDWW